MSTLPIDTLRTVKLRATRMVSRGLLAVAGIRYRQIVVCGYPRGGTSLLYNMLSASLDGFRFEDFEIPAEYRMHRLGNIASKFPLDALNIHRLPELNLHDKSVAVIGMVRDPRDLVTSRHPVVPDRYFIGYDYSWWPQDTEFREWKFDAPGILPVYDAMASLETSSPVPYLCIRYEDLVADPADVQRRIGEKFGFEFSGRFEDFHQRGDRLAYRYQGRTAAKDPSLVREDKPADTSRAGKWRKAEHRGRVTEQFSACPRLFEIVRSYGYEDDDSWFDEYKDG